MSFYDAVRHCYRKYASGRGRASRAEYWWFVLFSALAFVVLVITTIVVASTIVRNMRPTGFEDLAVIAMSIVAVYFVSFTAFGIPLIAAQVRRLHDVGQPGYWVAAAWGLPLLSLLLDGGLQRLVSGPTAQGSAGGTLASIAGTGFQLLVLVLTLLPSQPAANRHGAAAAGTPPQ